MFVSIVQVFAVLNTLLLAVLLTIWGKNWWQLRSKHTLGLLIFAIFLLLENGLVLYYYLLDPTLSAWWHDESAVPIIVWQAHMAIHVAQTIGLLFLVWITVD